MVPSGDATEKTVQALLSSMEAGDTIIDGGNSNFKDDVRGDRSFVQPKACTTWTWARAAESGALERGYCMMIGGPKEAVQRLDPIFKTLAPGGETLRALRDGKK